MTSRFLFLLTALLGVAACVHTPPGTPVQLATAKRAEVVRLPATPVPVTVAASRPTAAVSQEENKTALVADAYSRGEFCMSAGKDSEAIAAFNEVVKLDPSFTDAWDRLAALYEKNGKEKEAMDAFKRAKLARQ